MKDALIRMEYKLDLIIRALQAQGLMIPELPDLSGIEQDTCPVCNTRISMQPDFSRDRMVYTCGCKLPRSVVPGISQLLTKEENNGRSTRNPENEVLQQPPERDRDR